MVALSMLVAPAAADGADRRSERLSSFDGTRILTHFFPAPAGLRGPDGTAPTVMLAHGWAGSGATETDDATSAWPARATAAASS